MRGSLGRKPAWPLLMVVKNWLFPFSLFVLGRRLIRNRQQLWFLILCVAVVSCALSLHGLRDGLTTGNLLSNRPAGLLTGQANLFAGFLAMHALLLLFVSRTAELGRTERVFLTVTALLMMATLHLHVVARRVARLCGHGGTRWICDQPRSRRASDCRGPRRLPLGAS